MNQTLMFLLRILCKCASVLFIYFILSPLFLKLYLFQCCYLLLYFLYFYIYIDWVRRWSYPYFCVFFYGWSRHWKFFKIEKEDIKITISIYCIFVFAFDQFCKRYNRNAVYVFSVVYFFSVVLIVPGPP